MMDLPVIIIRRLISFANSIFTATINILIGDKYRYLPPPILYIVWLTFFILRIYPATLSLYQDEIWILVVSINQPWKTVLGFSNYFVGNHILYSALSNVIIGATGHHWVELTYRIPSIVASLLICPLGFAVFRRYAGKWAGIVASVLFCIIPTFSFHASSARGYMLWFFCALWAFGISPGVSRSVKWGRLTFAYFLLGLCHSLSIITLAVFAFVGCFTGKVRHKAGVWVMNCVAAVPAFLFCILPMASLFAYEKSNPRPLNWNICQLVSFLPQSWNFFFGSPWIPGTGLALFVVFVIGIVHIFRQSILTGISLCMLTFHIAGSIIVKNNPLGCDRILFTQLIFVILAACIGVKVICRWAINKRISVLSFKRKTYLYAAFLIFIFLAWLPKIAENLLTPKQDYLSLFREYTGKYPLQKKLIGIETRWFTPGLEYYARQFGLKFVKVDTPEQARREIVESDRPIGAVVASTTEIDPLMLDWTRKHLVIYKTWNGLIMPTSLYIAEDKSTQ